MNYLRDAGRMHTRTHMYIYIYIYMDMFLIAIDRRVVSGGEEKKLGNS